MASHTDAALFYARQVVKEFKAQNIPLLAFNIAAMATELSILDDLLPEDHPQHEPEPHRDADEPGGE
jgi:hypothetical protein